MIDLIQTSHDASARGESILGVNARHAVFAGQNRLKATTGIFTGDATNAAVRMHVSPVFGNFWAYCPKTKTRHFQHRKVAT